MSILPSLDELLSIKDKCHRRNGIPRLRVSLEEAIERLRLQATGPVGTGLCSSYHVSKRRIICSPFQYLAIPGKTAAFKHYFHIVLPTHEVLAASVLKGGTISIGWSQQVTYLEAECSFGTSWTHSHYVTCVRVHQCETRELFGCSQCLHSLAGDLVWVWLLRTPPIANPFCG